MTFVKQIFHKSKHLLLYGGVMAVLIFVLKWLQWTYLIADNSTEIYVGLVAVFFTGLGVWIATQLTKPKIETVVVEKEVYRDLPIAVTVDEDELKRLDLSKREYEVLQLIVQGHSNAEIAENLFLSISTIKTHVSNLFTKMEVKSRTQAVEKARRLKITA